MGASEGSNWDFIKESHHLFRDKRLVRETVLNTSQIYFGSKKHKGYSSRSPQCLALFHPISPHVRVLTIKWQSNGRGDSTVLALDTALKVYSCWTGIMWYYRLCQQEETVSPFEEMGSTLYLLKDKGNSLSTLVMAYFDLAYIGHAFDDVIVT